jgi:hypothetical protein
MYKMHPNTTKTMKKTKPFQVLLLLLSLIIAASVAEAAAGLRPANTTMQYQSRTTKVALKRRLQAPGNGNGGGGVGTGGANQVTSGPGGNQQQPNVNATTNASQTLIQSPTASPIKAPTASSNNTSLQTTMNITSAPNCSDSVAALLWLNVTFDVLAANASAAVSLGDAVHDLVETRLTHKLDIMVNHNASSNSTTLSDTNFCSGVLTALTLYPPSLSGQSCTGLFLSCFQMVSVLRLDYLGPPNQKNVTLLQVINDMPHAFRNLTALGVNFVEAVAFAPQTDTLGSSNNPALPIANINTSTNQSSTGGKPTGLVVMSFAVAALVASAGGVAARRRQLKRRSSKNVLDRIKVMSDQQTMNVSVDNLRLHHDETFHNDSFDDFKSDSTRTTPEKLQRRSLYDTSRSSEDSDIQAFESFEVDEYGRMFHGSSNGDTVTL